ncbi:hypothetical protein AQI95_01130 [Streptomyces yokosukanensis]|uniref:Secreted protein n=1 Tax=Streptomyces yokosukanensis TaxID=67386 RepID=A0A124HHJ0_9ACTN|nr:DUF6344 domain-containing protein [Streptomyces yokosukanensis]KUN10362.1 hypothetical protein AQI95_01130 [Streptomyces yokosukanensis]
MTQNKVMKLWTAIGTAIVALCTALGLITTTATAATASTATPQPEGPRTSTVQRTAPTVPAPRHWAWSHGRALPPTMKQRIRAEAHGKSPSCRHRPPTDSLTESTAVPEEAAAASLDC